MLYLELYATFFAPKWPLAVARDHLRGQKSLDFVPGPFRMLEMAPFSDFQGLISQTTATFTAQVH